jgi:hypothetical protein
VICNDSPIPRVGGFFFLVSSWCRRIGIHEKLSQAANGDCRLAASPPVADGDVLLRVTLPAALFVPVVDHRLKRRDQTSMCGLGPLALAED